MESAVVDVSLQINREVHRKEVKKRKGGGVGWS